MNWTSRTPIENVKCIVETNTGSVFPAHCINGTWWNTEKAFVIGGVTRWVIYPEGEQPNDYIAPEVLLKYAWKEYRTMKEVAKEESGKVIELRKLNKELTEDFNRTYQALTELRAKTAEQMDGYDAEIYKLKTEKRGMILELEELKKRQEGVDAGRVEQLQKKNKRLRGVLKSFVQLCEVADDLTMV